MPTAFVPSRLSGSTLRNRIVMASLTRRRAYGPGLSATPLMAELLRAACVCRTDHRRGYATMPWRAGVYVHARHTQRCAGGLVETHHRTSTRRWRHDLCPAPARRRRMNHPDLLGRGLRPLAPSAVAADGVVRVNVTEPAIRRPYPARMP
jgi:N-ethylmaleimide reductase